MYTHATSGTELFDNHLEKASMMGSLPIFPASFSAFSLSSSSVLSDHFWFLARAFGSRLLGAAYSASSPFFVQMVNSFYAGSVSKYDPKPPAQSLLPLHLQNTPPGPHCWQSTYLSRPSPSLPCGTWHETLGYSPLGLLGPIKCLAQPTLFSLRKDLPTQAWARQISRLREY